MKRNTGIISGKKSLKFILCLMLIVSLASTTLAQNVPPAANNNAAATDPATLEIPAEIKKPAMENVFFNVLWSSLTGGVLYAGISTLDENVEPEERYSTNRLYGRFFLGATFGGFVGLGIGVYLSVTGVSFDQNLTRIAMEPFQPQYSPIEDPTLYSMSASPLDPETVILPLVVTRF